MVSQTRILREQQRRNQQNLQEQQRRLRELRIRPIKPEEPIITTQQIEQAISQPLIPEAPQQEKTFLDKKINELNKERVEIEKKLNEVEKYINESKALGESVKGQYELGQGEGRLSYYEAQTFLMKKLDSINRELRIAENVKRETENYNIPEPELRKYYEDYRAGRISQYEEQKALGELQEKRFKRRQQLTETLAKELGSTSEAKKILETGQISDAQIEKLSTETLSKLGIKAPINLRSDLFKEYIKAGFSESDANILAKESEKRGQSFTITEAKKILKDVTIINESKIYPMYFPGFVDKNTLLDELSLKPIKKEEKKKERKGFGLELFGTAEERKQYLTEVFSPDYKEIPEEEMTAGEISAIKTIKTIKEGFKEIIKGVHKEIKKEVPVLNAIVNLIDKNQDLIDKTYSKISFEIQNIPGLTETEEGAKLNRELLKESEELGKKINDYKLKYENYNIIANKYELLTEEEKQKEFNKLFKEYIKLAKEQVSLSKEIEDYENKKKKAEEISSKYTKRFFEKGTEAALMTPITLTQFTTKSLTKPEESLYEIVSLPATVSKSFAQDPFGTAGELAGQYFFFKGASRAISEVRLASLRANTLSKVRNVKLDVAIDVEISNAIPIRKDILGRTQFNVNSQVITKLIERKTGKVVEKIETDIISDVVTARTPDAAIKAYSNSIAYSLRKAGLRNYVKPPKITLTKDLRRAKTSATLRPIEGKEGLFKGTFETEILEAGKLKRVSKPIYQANIEGIGDILISRYFARAKKTKTPAKTTGLGELIVKQGKQRFAVEKTGDVFLGGIENFDFSKAIADLTKETYKVRGFKRTAPLKFEGGLKITRLPFEEKIQPYLRRFRKEQRPLREKAAGITRTFIPGQALFDLRGFEFRKPGAKARLRPEEGKVDGNQLAKNIQEQLLGKGVGQELAVAKGVAKAEAGQIGRLVGEELKTKVSKQVTQRRARSEFAKQQKKLLEADRSLARVWSLEGVALTQAEKARLRTRQKEDQSVLNRLLSVSALQQPVSARERVRQFDLLGQPSALKTTQIQTPVQTGTPIIPIQPIVGFAPDMPKIPELKKPTFFLPRISKKGQDIDKNANKPHDVYIKEKGKYRKLTENPLPNKAEAKDFGSWVTDNSLAAEFKVKPSKQKPKPSGFNIPPNYYELTKQKYRPFLIRKKQQIPLSNTFIEEQQFRLDTNPEVRKITAARLLSEQKKKAQDMIKYNQNFSQLFGFQGNNKKLKMTKRKI